VGVAGWHSRRGARRRRPAAGWPRLRDADRSALAPREVLPVQPHHPLRPDGPRISLARRTRSRPPRVTFALSDGTPVRRADTPADFIGYVTRTRTERTEALAGLPLVHVRMDSLQGAEVAGEGVRAPQLAAGARAAFEPEALQAVLAAALETASESASEEDSEEASEAGSEEASEEASEAAYEAASLVASTEASEEASLVDSQATRAQQLRQRRVRFAVNHLL